MSIAPSPAPSLSELAPLITFAGVLVTAIVTWLVARSQKKGQPEHALIDQLQEERDSNRSRIDALESSMRELQDEMSVLRVKETSLLIYVSTLRNHIESGAAPPPPPWPPGLDPFTPNNPR